VTIHSFEAVLIRPEGVGTWIYLHIPVYVSATFNSRGQAKVKGAINGYPFRTTALPMGDGSHYLVVGKDIRDQIGASQGDTGKVMLEVDLDERQVDVPEDLLQALRRSFMWIGSWVPGKPRPASAGLKKPSCFSRRAKKCVDKSLQQINSRK
jgi:hypothetical protein